MCYGFTPVRDPIGGITWLPKKVLRRFEEIGLVFNAGKTVFPGHDAWIFIQKPAPYDMDIKRARFDLVPGHYLQKENLPLVEMLKRKNSRKAGSDGFSSYNVRSETMTEKSAFRSAWRAGARFVIPITDFFERPNEENAPEAYRNKEYRIHVPPGRNIAGIWDSWENNRGKKLDSFGIITLDSAGNSALESIYQSRSPLILRDDQVEEWLSPKTTPIRSLEMIRLVPAEELTIEEVIPVKPPPMQTNLFD